ncbi:hypothetical protein JCM10213_003260 [Rhodosporidiobolus nylandii]
MLLNRLPSLGLRGLPTSISSSRLFSSASVLLRPVQLLKPTELHSLLTEGDKGKDVVVLDASWFMPGAQKEDGTPRDGWKEYRKRRVEGSGYWHLDQISSPSPSPAPTAPGHDIPSKELFEDACSRLGISRESHVVLYDTHPGGFFSAPRGAFTFSHFSHPHISILSGGLSAWESAGLPVSTTGPRNPNPHDVESMSGLKGRYQPIFSELLYSSRPRVESYFIADIEELFTSYKVPEGAERAGEVKQWEEMNANIEKGGEGFAVLDARPEGRFHGTTPEPRPNLPSGHMPYSHSLPSSAVLHPETKELLPPAELEKVFEQALGKEGWEKVKRGERGVVNSCGSGMTAAILWLALQRCGVSDNVGLYDESWTGYASRKESKIVKTE